MDTVIWLFEFSTVLPHTMNSLQHYYSSHKSSNFFCPGLYSSFIPSSFCFFIFLPNPSRTETRFTMHPVFCHPHNIWLPALYLVAPIILIHLHSICMPKYLVVVTTISMAFYQLDCVQHHHWTQQHCCFFKFLYSSHVLSFVTELDCPDFLWLLFHIWSIFLSSLSSLLECLAISTNCYMLSAIKYNLDFLFSFGLVQH